MPGGNATDQESDVARLRTTSQSAFPGNVAGQAACASCSHDLHLRFPSGWPKALEGRSSGSFRDLVCFCVCVGARREARSSSRSLPPDITPTADNATSPAECSTTPSEMVPSPKCVGGDQGSTVSSIPSEAGCVRALAQM